MPFAKVGAMPMATSSSEKKKYNGGSGGTPARAAKPRGITMEDLKKQTALRLAQEQNQGNGDPTMTGALVPPPPPPTTIQQQHYPSTSQYRGQLYPRNDAPSYGRGSGLMYPASNQPLPQQQQQPALPPPPPQVNHHHPRINMYPTNGRLPQPQQQHQQPPQLQSYNNMHAMEQQQQQLPLQPPPPSMMPQHPGGYATSSYASGYGSNVNATTAAPSTMNSGSGINHGSLQMGQARYDLSAANAASANNLNKLPHGLTVHELKEMTKARLQAEAAEKQDADIAPAQRERGVSPLDFEVSSIGAGSAARERTFSRDSATGRSSSNPNNNAYYQNPVAGGGGVPSNVTESEYVRPVSHSPSLRYSSVNGTDTWDSASVASHNSNALSDNYGSETASDMSGSMGQNRTRSFTVPTLPSADDGSGRDTFPGPSSSVHASPRAIGMLAFDAAVGGNRRRAVTLSPNTGSILEDRPHHGTWTRDRLNLPSFGGSSTGPASIQARQQRGYSPVLEQLGLEDPPIISSGSDSVIGSSVLGSSFSDFQSTSAHSSEFLRESSSSEARVPAPPPGFRSSDPTAISTLNSRHTGFSPDQSVQSVQDTFLQGDKNPWDTNERRRLASVENVASDLGSILNLSGTDRQDRERANTYTLGSSFPASLPSHGNIFNSNGGFPPKDSDPSRY